MTPEDLEPIDHEEVTLDELVPDALSIDRGRAALLIIDVQERLSAAMPADVAAKAVRNIGVLIEMARRFSMPVVVSQQYPKGLGPTVAAIESILGELPALHRFDKIEFGCAAAPAFVEVREALGNDRQWIVTGMETHVCVYQTVRQLVAAGDRVHVMRDAVVSRTKENWKVGLGLMAHAGAVISSTETVLFDVLERAGSDHFKELSKLIK